MLDAVDVRGLLALLLSDGSLVCYRTPAGGYVQLTLSAGIQESAFLEEKVAEFRQFVASKAQIVHYNSTPRSNGKTTPCLRFRASSARLRPVFNLLYPGGERRITAAVLGMLGAQAAAWLWASGCKSQRGGGVELSRVGISLEEAGLVSQWLATVIGAESALLPAAEEGPRRPRLWFPPDQAGKMRQALEPYAPPSRLHLFREETWDVSAIRSARTELLLGRRHDSTAGPEEATLAGAAAA